jgi:hypothetical protein
MCIRLNNSWRNLMAQLKRSAKKTSVAGEVAVYRKTLKANKRVVKAGQPMKPGTTHVEHRGRNGVVRLERKRFSAI